MFWLVWLSLSTVDAAAGDDLRTLTFNFYVDLQRRDATHGDIYPFEKFMEDGYLKTGAFSDMCIFSHMNADYDSKGILWHAAFILNGPQHDTLAIYHFLPKTNLWNLLSMEDISPSKIIRSLSTSDGTILAIGTTSDDYKKACDTVAVYLLNINNKLIPLQTLKTNYFSDITLWKGQNGIFLAVATDHEERGDDLIYEFNNPIYLWKNKYFDVFQYIPSSSARKITPFQIGTSHFIAVAFHNNNYGKTNIYSEIYKYDLHDEEYVSVQKLATRGAIDIQFFDFQWNSYSEAFIVIVNEYNKPNDKDYYTTSIVYKHERGLFVPFQKLPVDDVVKWFQIQGKKGEFLLIGISQFNKIKLFQYNGWLFEEIVRKPININYDNYQIGTVKNFILLDYPILTITFNHDGESVSYFYRPIFRLSNPIRELKDKIEGWCKIMHDRVEKFNVKHFQSTNKVKDLSTKLRKKVDEKRSRRKTTISIKNAKINVINTEAVYANDYYINSHAIENINKIMNLLDSQSHAIQSLYEAIYASLSSNYKVITKSLFVNNLNLKCSKRACNIHQATISQLNHNNVDNYIKKLSYIEDGFSKYKKIDIDHLTVKNSIYVSKINGKRPDIFSKFVLSNAESNGVLVKGTVLMNRGFSLSGHVMKVKLGDDNVLIKNRDQVLKGHFKIPKVKCAILETKEINGLSFRDFQDSMNRVNKTIRHSLHPVKVTVDDVFVSKFDKKHDVNLINLLALKVSGEQVFQESFSVSKMTVGRVSKKNNAIKMIPLKGIVKINGGTFDVGQDVRLKRFSIKDLTIKKRLNNIAVNDDKLDVLLLNSDSDQRLTGEKFFENVELNGPINLIGKINKGNLERKNPVSLIQEPLRLIGDYTIVGNVSVESMLSCENLANNNSDRSVKHIQQRALKLTDSVVSMPLVFSQPLAIKTINCDSINEINPTSWLRVNSDKLRIISGRKIFLNNLNIKGNCSVQNTINKIKPKSFDNILRTVGDQEIQGKIFIKNLSAQRLNCSSAVFGEKSLESLLTFKKNFYVPSVVNIDSHAVVHYKLTTNSTDVYGKINEQKIENVLNDTVTIQDRIVMSNHVFVKELIVGHLRDDAEISSVDLKAIDFATNWTKEVYISDRIYLEKIFNVKNILLKKHINGIPGELFGYNWLLSYGDQTLLGKFNFESFVCNKEIHIESGEINRRSMRDTYDNAVWKSGDVRLANVIYTKSPIIVGNLRIGGYINGIHTPMDFILRGMTKLTPEKILAYKTVLGDVNVGSNVYSASIYGVPLEKYCGINNVSQYSTYSFMITGNAYFNNEPRIKKIYGELLSDLSEDIWFSDMDIFSKSSNKFNNVVFKNTVRHEGTLNKFDMHWLQSNYFSLSSDQILDSDYKISNLKCDEIVVENGIEVDGEIRGLNFKYFYENTLQKGKNQILKSPMWFYSITGNVDIQSRINGLYFNTDMMRFSSGSNEVTGKKHVNGNLFVDNLFTKYLQNVDVDYWTNNSVNLARSMNTFQDKKSFRRVKINNLNALGNINEKSTNYLLRKSDDQELSGKFTFLNDVHFRNVFLKGSINDNIHIEDFDTLMNKNHRVTIIETPKTMTSVLSGEKFTIRTSSNDEYFMSVHGELTKFYYPDNKNSPLRSLIDNSVSLYEKLNRDIKYIVDMETVQFIPINVGCMERLQYGPNADIYLTLSIDSPGHSEVQLLKWSEGRNSFHRVKSTTLLHFDGKVTKLFSSELGRATLFYVETLESKNGFNKYIGRVFTFVPSRGFVEAQQLQGGPTNSIVSLVTEEKFCILFTYALESARLYCRGERSNLRLRQKLHIYNSTEVNVISVRRESYIIISNPKEISVMHWARLRSQKLTSVQTLPAAACISIKEWKGSHYLGAAYDGITSIYRFDENLSRFIEIESIKQDVAPFKINLSRINDQLLLDTLSRIDARALSVRFYKHDGLAGFKPRFSRLVRLPSSFKTSIAISNDVTRVNVMASETGLLVQKLMYSN